MLGVEDNTVRLVAVESKFYGESGSLADEPPGKAFVVTMKVVHGLIFVRLWKRINHAHDLLSMPISEDF